MKRHKLRRLRQTLFGQQPIWQIHEPALNALVELLYGPSARSAKPDGARPDEPDPETVAQRLGMQSADAPTTQMVGHVAVLPILGVLQQKASWVTRYMGWTATEILERDFKAAIGDSQVKGIVLYCDSPGGTAVGNEEVARTIFQARGQKPIVAFVRGLCASACYYLAASADRIVASPSSTIGSIGTIWVHAEYSKLFQAMGVGVNVLRHGENKGIGNIYEPLTPAARAKLQKWIDDYGNQFEQAVARGRGISQAEVRSKYGQGDAFVAPEAKTRGMIDAVASWEQVLASLKVSPAPIPQPGQQADRIVVAGQQLATNARFSLAAGSLLPGWAAFDQALFDQSLAQSFAPASAIPAGVSAGLSIPSGVPAAGASETEKPTMKISMKVRGALLARGMISAIDATDELCLVALNAYFAARGEACPQEDDKIVASLFVSSVPPAPATATPVTQPAVTAPAAGGAAPNVQQAHDREMAEARTSGATSERQRQTAIRASAQLLSMPADAVQAAIDGGQPHETVIAAWHQQLGQRERPISQGGANATVGQDGSERFAADACLALQMRLDHLPASQAGQVNDQVRRMSNAPLSFFAQQCLVAAGVRADFEMMPKEQLFEMAFAMDGPGRYEVGSSYVPFNRPGSFPNLLSNLANKVLDAALELAEVSYPAWTGMWPGDLPDFKPAPVVAKGQHDEMDEILDAEASKEFGLSEEMLSYMILRRFSNFFALTPVMAANDDLGAFDEGLLGLEMAWHNTVNRLCLALLTGNVTLLDGFALFDNTNHGNDITTGGGAPSAAAWQTMQLRTAAQRGIGGKGYFGGKLRIALVPPNHKVAADQVFAPLNQLNEVKQPTTDATINTYRGQVQVVEEAELQASSNDVWYGLCRPRGLVNSTVIRAYFRGWGKNGRRQRWYDPLTKCWNFELEGRVGAATKQYRTAVRNDGTA